MSEPLASQADEPVLDREYEIEFLLLNIRQGTSCQIIGPPGAGKSHLLKLFVERVDRDHKNIEIFLYDRSYRASAPAPKRFIQELEQIGARSVLSRYNSKQLTHFVVVLDEPSELWESHHDNLPELRKIHRAGVVLIVTTRQPLEKVFADDPSIASCFGQFETLYLVPETQRDMLDARLPFSVRESGFATEAIRSAPSRIRHLARTTVMAAPLVLAALTGGVFAAVEYNKEAEKMKLAYNKSLQMAARDRESLHEMERERDNLNRYVQVAVEERQGLVDRLQQVQKERDKLGSDLSTSIERNAALRDEATTLRDNFQRQLEESTNTRQQFREVLDRLESHYKEELASWKAEYAALRENHKRSLNSLGSIYQQQLSATTDFARRIDILTQLGDIRREEGKADQALGDYQEALRLATGLTSVEVSRKKLSVLKGMAQAAVARGETARAIDYLTQAQRLAEQLGLKGSPLAEIFSLQGDLLAKANRFEEAIQSFDRATQILESNSPASGTLASTLMSYAELSVSLTDKQKAIMQGERAFKIAEEIYGPKDPRMARYIKALARLYIAVGDKVKANEILKRL